jgi:hypothetical protein
MMETRLNKLLTAVALMKVTSDEKDNAKKLTTLVKSGLSLSVNNLPNNEALMGFLSGETTPPPIVKKAADMLHAVAKEPGVWKGLMPSLDAWMESKGVSSGLIKSLMLKLAPILDVPVDSDDTEETVRRLILQVTSNISGPPPHQFTALVTCRNCGFSGLY